MIAGKMTTPIITVLKSAAELTEEAERKEDKKIKKSVRVQRVQGSNRLFSSNFIDALNILSISDVPSLRAFKFSVSVFFQI
jgi:hypothetical protein